MRRYLILSVFLLGACQMVAPAPVATVQKKPASSEAERSASIRAARRFIDVVARVEPVAEAECRRMVPDANCDLVVVVDDRPGQPPNAYQTEGRDGQPVLAFTLSMIGAVGNADELAFVMGHEAAHHILGHLARTRNNAAIGATIASGVAALAGAGPNVVRATERLGASVGARSYSKEFELEADQLGTVISAKSGYNPVLGAQFFNRIPDPGDKFLGTHPPNASRMDIVRRTAARL